MKQVIQSCSAIAFCALVFSGCGKLTRVDSARNADELAVLAQSSFYEGELAPAADPVVQLTNGATGDGGFIPGGGSGGNGNDTGSIPTPDPGTLPPVTPEPGPGTDPIAQNPPTVPPLDPVVPEVPSPSPNPNPNPGTDPVVPTPPGGDGGEFAGPTPPGGNPPSDGGTVPTPPGGGQDPDGGTVTPPIAENPPTTPPVIPPVDPNPPVDPGGPIAENPPTTPPVTPPVVPPTTPPVTPGDGDGGVVQNPPGGNPPGDGGAVPPVGPATNVTLYRACSRMRSEIPFPKFVFFEEADRPTLSLEAKVELPLATPVVQMAGFGNQPHPMESQLLNALVNPVKKGKTTAVPVTLARRDLADVDLMKGAFKTRLEIAVAVAKAWYPKTWAQIYVKAAVCDDRDGDGLCQDELAPYQLLAKEAAFKLGHVPTELKLMVWNGRSKTLAGDPRLCEVQYSPIVLDLSGNGFKFTSPSQGVWFDLNDTGEPLVTGWTAGNDDAFLVHDLDGNGSIDSGAELFGSATRLPDGTRAANGFKAMQALDSNGNGTLDRGDLAWGELQLWIDRSHDGVSSPDELFSLDRAQVTSIRLDYLDVLEVDAHGNETRQRSIFRRTVQGRSIPRQVIDVWFSTMSAD